MVARQTGSEFPPTFETLPHHSRPFATYGFCPRRLLQVGLASGLLATRTQTWNELAVAVDGTRITVSVMTFFVPLLNVVYGRV